MTTENNVSLVLLVMRTHVINDNKLTQTHLVISESEHNS